MWPGYGGWSGTGWYCRCHEAQPGGFSYERQPPRETFAALRENDMNTTWREFYDAETDAMYYHNTITNKTQWEHPGVTVKKHPPPPSSPPPTLVKDGGGPEHSNWRHLTNDSATGKYWYNTVTGTVQHDRPACCKKYR